MIPVALRHPGACSLVLACSVDPRADGSSLAKAGSDTDDILALTTTREGATNLRNYFPLPVRRRSRGGRRHGQALHRHSRGANLPQWRRTPPRLLFPRVRTPCGHGAQVIIEGREEKTDGGERNEDPKKPTQKPNTQARRPTPPSCSLPYTLGETCETGTSDN